MNFKIVLLIIIISLMNVILSNAIEDYSYMCDDLRTNVICANDCETLLICYSGTANLIGQCQKLDQTKPYCVGNTCVSTPDSSNANCTNLLSSNFQCTSYGTFPDPFDCTKFHNCLSYGSNAMTYSCPPQTTYISSLKMCKKTIVCQKFNCPKDFSVVAYKYDPAYYGYCGKLSDGTPHIIMLKCEDEINYIYDATIGKCKYNCKGIGRFVNRFDCKTYTFCYKENGIIKSSIVPCSLGYYFNAKTLLCEPDYLGCTNEIQKPITTTTKTITTITPPTPSINSTPSTDATTTIPSTNATPPTPSTKATPVTPPTP